jgi:SNF2 family DNA or RNA helicase
MELYHFLEPVGGISVFGTPTAFRNEYVAQARIWLWLPVTKALPAERNEWARKKGYLSWAQLQQRALAGEEKARALTTAVQTGRAKFRRGIWKDTGVNERRLPEFKRLAGPMILRRTVRDLDDAQLPDVQPNEVWLDLLPAQRERYAELQQGILRRLRDSGEEITHVQAVSAYTRARQICSGLAALDDGRDVSAKLDWAVDRITGDLSEDKIFAFVYFRENVQALSNRLNEAGVGHVLLWSNETDPAERDRRIQRFSYDDDCRVVIATTTAERSLNLQAASHLIAVDTIANPARMTQILGRAVRLGSRHRMVVFHQLLARGTYEEDLLESLRGEQALANAVWDDEGQLFTRDLSPRQLMAMVARTAA